MNKKSPSKLLDNQTDWKRVDAIQDKDIQFDEDSPHTTPEDWATAVVHTGLPVPRKKTQIALRLDSEVRDESMHHDTTNSRQRVCPRCRST